MFQWQRKICYHDMLVPKIYLVNMQCMSLDASDARHQLSRARALVKRGLYIEALGDTNAVVLKMPQLATAHQLKGCVI